VTQLNVDGVFSSMGTEGLTAEARKKLESARLDATIYDRVYCSPAIRCRETAASLGLTTLIEDERLAERHFGVFDGLTPGQCHERYPAEFESFRQLDADFAIPGGESRNQHFARISSWLCELVAARHALAITHGGTIDFLYRLATGEPLHGGSTVFAGPNGGISIFDLSGPEISLIEFGTPL
jgi:broad specificity phosphatase PhoE